MSNKIKAIKEIIPAPPPHMVGDGFRVHNFFPSNPVIGKKGMSPFFLLDYNAKIEFAPSDTPRGVDVHPHRGFETVTIAYKGRIAHHDSTGNSGIIGEGDVQWMTAGSGILHKEYHEKEFSKSGGAFHMVQLWVNLPAKHKMTPPKYQDITNDSMGRYYLSNAMGVIEVIAGHYKDIKGPASTFTPIHIYNARLKREATVEFIFPEHYNTGILVVEGQVEINEKEVSVDQLVFFANEGEAITVKARRDSVLLVLSGEPINEPIAQYGPFLMNTVAELEQAIDDVNAGRFGQLE